jgi:UDP-N-acetylmuramoylalanine--D-glutamate ligase
MNIPQVLVGRLKRPAAILGAGVSGAAAASLLNKAGSAGVIYDERGVGGGKETFGAAEAAQHDLVIYSPGFPQIHPWLSAARRAGILTIGELDFAALFWKDPLLAITGTNGKTTVTEFLAFAHKRNGRESIAVGNIGYPLSRIFELGGNRRPLPVCEVSSFQAEDLRYFAPKALLWTNFDEDHLDRHGDLETYFRAKYKLVERLAGKVLVVGESVAAFAKQFGLSLPDFTQVATRAEVADKIPSGSVFESFPQRENYALARRYWLDAGYEESALADAAVAFSLSGHRLTRVVEADGVSYWNDSKGTNFHAVLAALEAVGASGGAIHWLGGGQSKGGDIITFAQKVADCVKTASLIGETAQELQFIFEKKGILAQTFKNLPDAVRAARRAATDGDHVLFSPGFASFDMFGNYAERGRIFEKTVRGFVKPKGSKPADANETGEE